MFVSACGVGEDMTMAVLPTSLSPTRHALMLQVLMKTEDGARRLGRATDTPPLGLSALGPRKPIDEDDGQQLDGQQLNGQQLDGQQLDGQQLDGQQLGGQQLGSKQLEGRPQRPEDDSDDESVASSVSSASKSVVSRKSVVSSMSFDC
jgi:hypothetical protein